MPESEKDKALRSRVEKAIIGTVQSRMFTIDRSKIDEEARTVDLSFSSETPVARWWGREILDHGKGSMRMDRLNDGAAVLVDHGGDQIGVVEPGSVRITNDRKARAVLRFSKNPRAQEIFSDIVDQIRRNVSVSYEIHRMVLEEETDTENTYRAMDWEPVEISIVSVPADVNVGVGRTRWIEGHGDERERILPAQSAATREVVMSEVPVTPAAAAAVPSPIPPVTPASVTAIESARADDVKAMEQNRIRAIRNLCDMNKLDEKYQDYWIRSGMSLDKITDDMLRIMEERGKHNPQTVAKIGLTGRETESFSLVRAIVASVENNWNNAPFELECSRAIAKALNRPVDPRKFFIPYEVQERGNRTPIEELAYRMMKRDMTVAAAAQGGYLVSTTHVSFIELLRNRSVLFNMGAVRLSGLRDNVTIPKQTVAATATWLANEAAAISEVTQTFDQLPLSPKTVGGYTEISRQLMLQSNPAIEGLVSADLAAVVALDIDLKGLNGSGASGQPQGIIGTSGIGSVTGASMDYADVIEFQTDVFAGNALTGNCGFVGTGAVAGVLKGRVKFTNTGMPIWEGRLDEGMVDGYRAMASNQMPTGDLLFGDFGQVIVAEWGVLEVEVNPFADFKAGIIGVRAIASIDIGVRYPTAFSLATSVS